jgi:hypothetical protein
MTRRAQLLLVVVLAAAAAGAWLSGSWQASDRFGYTPDPEGNREFTASLGDDGLFRSAAPRCMAAAEDRDTFLWRPMLEAHRARYGRDWVVGRQEIGSCVAWGAMHAVYVAESVSWKTGIRVDPPPVPSTEAIYGGSRVEARSRTFAGWSDGSTGFHAAKWLREWGVVYREPFPSLGFDLTKYDSKIEKEWGAYGCGGQNDGGKMDAIARQHPVRYVAKVGTWDELKAAIVSGFPCTIASNQGFSTGPRDALGFSRPQSNWAHQMCVIGYRTAASGREGVLILNSWGPNYMGVGANAGGKWPPDQPDGSFWCDRQTMERGILSADDSWAIGDIDGWKPRDLDNHGWQQLPPASVADVTITGE